MIQFVAAARHELCQPPAAPAASKKVGETKPCPGALQALFCAFLTALGSATGKQNFLPRLPLAGVSQGSFFKIMQRLRARRSLRESFRRDAENGGRDDRAPPKKLYMARRKLFVESDLLGFGRIYCEVLAGSIFWRQG
jgi:hypothetical protein